MKQKSIIWGTFLFIMILLFYRYYQPISQNVLSFSTQIQSIFINQKDAFVSSVQTHFRQKEQIEILQKKIKELEPKASLSVAFATKINHLSKETNLTLQHPYLHLVQTLGYQSMHDKNKLWLEFPSFKKEKIYGLIFQGFSAGIIREKSNQPLAILQSDKESIFSVFIGENHIQGIAYGDGETIMIKYIPSYENPKVGDEVITSGNDHIFYEGIKVGKLISVETKDMYKIATLKPYVDLKGAQFFYAVEVK